MASANSLESVIILAAGEGTRMKSTTAKVLHPIAGRSLIHHVLAAVTPLTPKVLSVVTGAHRESVEAQISSITPKVEFVHQAQRNGTGHAIQLALAQLDISDTVLILSGDTPLITDQTLQSFLDFHVDGDFGASVLTAELMDPFGYGRILRDAPGKLVGIVEERDATDSQREIREVNTGMYLFDVPSLRAAIERIVADNSQGELYLTDVIGILSGAGLACGAYLIGDPAEALGINDRSQLAVCAALMQERINEEHMLNGVSIVDPLTTWIDVDVTIAHDVTIYPGSMILGKSTIAQNSIIGPRTRISDTTVAEGASVVESYCDGAIIGARATIGPFTYLRPGAELAADSKAGAYVEIKNARIGEGSKVPHLSYVGDATIGVETNIGAATIFVNYDGVEKHHTTVGDHVRIGSDTMLVAPVTIGDGAYTAAGSVITEDVPAGAIGVGRAKQRNIINWVLRKRSGSSSAQAAKKAGASLERDGLTENNGGRSE